MSEIIDMTRAFNLRYHIAKRDVQFVIDRKKNPDGTFIEGFCPVCYASQALRSLNMDARISAKGCDWEIIGRRAAWGAVCRTYSHTCEKGNGDEPLHRSPDDNLPGCLSGDGGPCCDDEGESE